MGHIDVSGVEYALSDGRVLLNDVSFRVGDGAKVALIGPNGSGKTTLIRMICGDISPDEGSCRNNRWSRSHAPVHWICTR
jgi:ABC-type multidrug transport system ATPase subunit